MDNRFYVYEHRRASDGVVFYIGKGSGRRLWVTSKRNKHWENIVRKYGFTFHKVYDGLTEEDAFKMEAKLIKKYGVENLCNMTGGGDGMKSPCAEVRARFSELQKGRWKNPEYRANIISKTSGVKQSAETRLRRSKSMTGLKRSEIHCSNLSASLSGMKKSTKHRQNLSQVWKGKRIGDKNPNLDRRIRFFTSESGAFIGTAYHFAKLNGLKRHNVDNLIRGRCKTHSGWSYEGDI